MTSTTPPTPPAPRKPLISEAPRRPSVRSPTVQVAPARHDGAGGCLIPLAGFLVMALVGYGAAKAIRGNDDEGLAQTFTLDRGTAGDQRWELKGVIDEQDDQCVFLYVGDDQVTGGCDTEASRARIDDQTLVLGLAPETSATAQVRLSDGTSRRVPTQPDDNLRRRWFITQKAGRLELAGPVVFYDANGAVVA